jgi:hypothetical protein
VVALLLLLLAAPETVETEHYRLVSEGPRAEAEEFGRVLEAAYGGFAAYFKATPRLPKGEKLEVRFFETREAWERALQGIGAVPAAGAGGFYAEGTRTAYLYRQPTRLFTRALLLHETTHQFHFLARTRNVSPLAYWYKEGVAECLGWNDWDGTELTLGVLPQVALENYPAKALEEIRAPGFDVEAVVEGKVDGSRPVAWAIYRYLSTGNAGKPLKGFERLAERLDGGAKPSALFWRTFGQPAAYRKALLLWLEQEQQPFVPVFNEWEPVGPNRIHGFAGVVTCCRLQRKATTFHATIEPPKPPWRAGGLLHYESNDDYALFLVDQGGYLRVMRRKGGTWQMLEEGEGPKPKGDGPLSFDVTADNDGLRISFDGKDFGPYPLPSPAFGLALESSDVTFRDVAWK